MFRFRLVEPVRHFDEKVFEIWEGKFLDTYQDENIYIYANVSTEDGPSLRKSEVRIYAHSWKDMYDSDIYEIRVDSETENHLKKILLDNIPHEDPVLCGFVWCHGFKDFSAFEVQLSEEDRNAIEEILQKYETSGTSERDVWDNKFSEVFSTKY